MPRYRVEHRYGSSTHGPWVEGDHVELDEEEAAWVNHDSEGTLKLVDPNAQAEEKRERQRLQSEALRRQREERERRDRTERIQGVSQADEPTRMDDVPQAQRGQADRVPADLVTEPMEPTGGGVDDGRSADTTDLPPGGVPRPDDHTDSEAKDSGASRTSSQKTTSGSRSTKATTGDSGDSKADADTGSGGSEKASPAPKSTTRRTSTSSTSKTGTSRSSSSKSK